MLQSGLCNVCELDFTESQVSNVIAIMTIDGMLSFFVEVFWKLVTA